MNDERRKEEKRDDECDGSSRCLDDHCVHIRGDSEMNVIVFVM